MQFLVYRDCHSDILDFNNLLPADYVLVLKFVVI